MFELKRLSMDAVPAALEKAERYRLLNEAHEAESICLDILEVDPNNEKALTTLLLALTDQFPSRLNVACRQAKELLPRLADDYQRAYYGGIIAERRAKALLDRHSPSSGYVAYDGIREALEHYEKAAELRPSGNDDAILRWNTCVRILESHPEVRPEPEEHSAQYMLE